jgi:selenide,water dikinase
VLVLTKAIGTGVVAQAIRADRAEPAWIEAATRSMERLNRAACEAGLRHEVTAATDVTGFGLLGHLQHLAAGSGLEARIVVARVPLLPGAREAAGQGLVPGGSKRNLRYVTPSLRGQDRVDPVLLTLLTDAQTSGGLLLATPPGRVESLLSELGPEAWVIGELVDGEPGALALEC